MGDVSPPPAAIDIRILNTHHAVKIEIVYEMFNKIRNLETFLPKTLYNFAIICYNVERKYVQSRKMENSTKIQCVFTQISHIFYMIEWNRGIM